MPKGARLNPEKIVAKYAAGQACNNCALYLGKESDAWGGCQLFAGKQISGKGWCRACAKKG